MNEVMEVPEWKKNIFEKRKIFLKGFQEIKKFIQELPKLVQKLPELVQKVPKLIQEVSKLVQEVPKLVQEVPKLVQEVPEWKWLLSVKKRIKVKNPINFISNAIG